MYVCVRAHVREQDYERKDEIERANVRVVQFNEQL